MRLTNYLPTPLRNEGRLRSHLIGIMSRVLHGSHLLIQYAAVFTRTPGDVNEFCQTSSHPSELESTTADSLLAASFFCFDSFIFIQTTLKRP